MIDAHSIRVWKVRSSFHLESTNEIVSAETKDKNRPHLRHSIGSVVRDNYVAMEVDEELLRQFLFRSHLAAGLPFGLLAPLSSRYFVSVSTGQKILSLIDSWSRTRTENEGQAEAEKGGLGISRQV